jgi:probable rRNA maturation factor
MIVRGSTLTENRPLVDLRIASGDWRSLPDAAGVADAAARAALAEAGLDAARVEISLLLTGDAEVAVLNGQFRGKPQPTNVLSWPAFPLAPPAPGQAPPLPPLDAAAVVPLGDIALAQPTIAREAAAQNLAFADHVTHLIVHGVLHLLGYDHGTEPDAELMEGIERHALARLGVADPYA